MSKKNPFSQAFSELISSVGGTNANGESTGSGEPVEETPISSQANRPTESRPTELARSFRSSSPAASAGKLTVIAVGTTVAGNMSVDGAAEIEGRLQGDIDCSGCLTVSGQLIGRSRVAEINVQGARIEGNIESKGDVHVRDGSVVIGNVSGQAMQLFGAVKGDITLPGHLTVGATAIVVGNIQAGSVDIQSGAAIDGYVAVKSNGRASSIFDQDPQRDQ